MVRRSLRIQAALERLPRTRAAWTSVDIQSHLTAAMDWPTLMAVSRLNRWGREVVRLEIRARIKQLLKTFIPGEYIEEFLDMLLETGGGIAGGLALELLLVNSDWYNPMKDPVKLEGLDPVAEPTPDLNILVPELKMGAWTAFMSKIGYNHQFDLGIGTCYEKAGVTKFTVFVERETTAEDYDPSRPAVSISACSQSIIRTVMRSPWSIQTNVVTANTVYSAFPHLSYDVVCLRNSKSHPFCGPAMRIPDLAYFEPYNGHWDRPCGKFCPVLKSKRRKEFRGVASFHWTLNEAHNAGRASDMKIARSTQLPNSFGVFCYNEACERGEEWLIPWNAPQGRLITPPKGL